MIRRSAALFAMLAFAASWMVGVWCGHSPQVRIPAALVGLLAGAIAGAGIGVALQKIVLARLAEQWRQAEVAAASAKAEKGVKPAKSAPPAPPAPTAAAPTELAEATR